MADITRRTSALLASDLQIGITPRDFTFYRGTAAQLIAEGLIPTGFKWPVGTDRVEIKVGKFTHSIGRFRPDGHKGPKSSWSSIDYWHLNRRPTDQPLDCGRAKLIFEKTAELEAVIFQYTSEYASLAAAARATELDDRYQAFRGMFIREPKHSRAGKRATSQHLGEVA